MSVPAPFIGVVLIWGTTPLAIQWSSLGGGFLFGVALWLVYGLLLRAWPIILANLITLGLTLTVLWHKLREDRAQPAEPQDPV